MHIAFFELQGWETPILRRRLKGHRLTFSREPLTFQNVKDAKTADMISIFIYSKIDKALLPKLPKLKLIATRSTGFDHVDVAACKKRHIAVSNVPYYGENTVAEHTFALILALSRNIHRSYVRTQRDDFSIEGLQGFDLEGKTLGVVGAGHIGLHVIRIARGFGMNVLAYDPHRDAFLSSVMGFQYADLPTLLRQADIVTLHLPYTSSTHHFLGKTEFQQMKKGALLINTARGGIVDTNALLWALKTKRLSGAGLDVIEGEEYIKEEKELLYSEKHTEVLKTLIRDHVLLGLENVVFTPHIAFYSREALQRILETTIENVLGCAHGVCKNAV